MLQEISIKNFGVIETARVSFDQGFHVLSGETGAGKSIFVQGISFALGSRSSTDCLRSGAKEASVSLVFDVSNHAPVQKLCDEWGVDLEDTDNILMIRRTLNQSGKSRGFLNDQPVTLKSLQELGQHLVNLVGQHAVQDLFEEAFLFSLLDVYGKTQGLHGEYLEALNSYRQMKRDYEELIARVEAGRRQQEFMQFQCEELERASLKPGEEEELESLKNRLKHRVALSEYVFHLNQALTEGEVSLSDQLGPCIEKAQKAAKLDGALAQVEQHLRHAVTELQEASQTLSAYSDDLQEEPVSFDQVQERLALLHELKRKHNTDAAGLIEKLATFQSQLAEVEDSDKLLEEKKQLTQKAAQKLRRHAKELFQKRTKVAQSIEKKLKTTLKDLDLPHAQICWRLTFQEDIREYSEHGGEIMELLISFNPGEPARPFQEILSGGELSRLLLALYEISLPKSYFGTLIFDEVDAGVGGGVAELIGRKLKGLSQNAQVFCITHLAQIASQARWHFAVEKAVKENRTFSQIRLLQGEERVQEVARMIAGVDITSQALSHAKALLKEHAA